MVKRILGLFLSAALLVVSALASSDQLSERVSEPIGYVALTFDDGPSGAITETFLKELEDRGAACTFFVCGYRMEDFPTDLSAYATHGHELGVHGWSHQYLRGLDASALQAELGETARMITELSGIRPAWLRPPGGLYDDAVRAAAAELELSIALWNVDPEDWNHRSQSEIVSHILRQVGDGDVILLHDIFETSRAAALELVDALQDRGYRLVTLSALVNCKGAEPEAGTVYSCFG